MDKKTLKAKIEIEAIVKQAQAEVDSFTESINQMWQYSAPPKKLLKQVEDLQLRIESLKQLTAGGVINSSDLSQAQGDYRAISKEIRNLTFEFSSLTEEQKRAFLSPQEKQEIEARNKAIANYTASLEKNKKVLEEIAAIQSKKQPKTEELNTKTTARDAKVQERNNLVAPEQTDEVKEYIKNLERLTEIQKQIKTNEKTLANLRAQGRAGGKQYASAEQNLATLRAEEAQLSRGQEAYEEYTTALKTYEEAIKPLEADIKTLNGEISSLETEIKDLDGQLAKLETQKVNTSLDDLKKTLKDLGVEGLEAVDSLDDIKVVLNDLEKSALKKVDGQIENVVDELKNLGKTANQAKDELDNANASLKEQEETLSRTQAFADRIKQFVGLAGAAQVLSKALRSSFEATKELDAVMTEMAVVTDLKVGDYWEQLPEHTARASELGVAIKEVYEAETLYYQQGLKTNEVVSISTETLKMARIAGLSAEDATQKMTAALRGFNMELNETSAQRIADVYSELAAITAADVGQISNAMSKTASIASSAGMEFETTAAFLSQIIETTQESAETAGTAMKTVIARFQELKKDPAEIGEVDGEIVDANAIETALRSVGVSLRDASGQFRDLDDVFLELSSKWDSLDKNTQRYIATIAAGSRQQSRFIAMMSDYGRTQELVNAANTSAGASNKQYEKTLDSLQSKLEKLKNAWTSFTQGIANSKLIKAGIDILTKLLETINKITDSFGEFSGAAKIALLVTALYLGDKAVKVFMTSIKETKSVFTSLGAVFTQTGATIKADIDGLTNKMRQFAAEASYVKDYYNSFGAGAAEPLREYQEALRATAKATKDLNRAEREGKKSGEEYVRLTKAKEKAIEQEKIAADKIRNSYLQNTQQQKLYDIAVKNGMQADRAAIMVTNEKVLAILREKGAIDELNNVIDENIAKDTLDTLSNSTNAASSFGKSLSDLGSKMSKFNAGDFFKGLKGGLKDVGKGFLNVLKQIGSFIAANWQLIVVLAVLIVAIVGLVHYIKYLQRNSPEGKLKAATEAASRAAEAADRATEAYKDLSSAFDSLEDKYKNLDNLTQGTREWKEAVREINAEVLDLINKNPELASMYESVDGVMRVKAGSQGSVDAVLDKAALEAAQAKAIEAQASLKVKKAENKVAYDKLSDDAKYGKWEIIRGITIAGTAAGAGAGAAGGAVGGAAIGSAAYGVGAVPGSVIGGIAGGIAGGILGGVGAHAGISAAFAEMNKTDQEITEQIAKDMAKGHFNPRDIDAFTEYLQKEFKLTADQSREWAETLSKSSGELLEFGNQINAVAEQERIYNETLAQQAMATMDLSKYTEDQIAIISGAASADAYAIQQKKAEEEAALRMANKQSAKDLKEEVAKQMYGADAKVSGNKITYKDGEEEKTIELTKEEFEANYAAMTATKNMAAALETIPGIVNKVGNSLNRLGPDLGDAFAQSIKDSSKLTIKQVEDLSKVSDKDLKTIYKSLSKEEQEYYGSSEEFIKQYRDSISDQDKVIQKAQRNLRQYTNNIELVNKKMTASSLDGFTKDLNKFTSVLSDNQEDMGVMVQEIDSISTMLSPEQFEMFMSAWNSFDKTDLDAWKEFEETLKVLGLDGIMTTASFQNLSEKTKEVANSIRRMDVNKLSEGFEERLSLIDKVRQQGSREFDKETYKNLISYDETLKKDFVQIGDKFMYLGGKMEDLIDTLDDSLNEDIALAETELNQKKGLQTLVTGLNEKRIFNQTGSSTEERDFMEWLEFTQDSKVVRSTKQRFKEIDSKVDYNNPKLHITAPAGQEALYGMNGFVAYRDHEKEGDAEIMRLLMEYEDAKKNKDGKVYKTITTGDTLDLSGNFASWDRTSMDIYANNFMTNFTSAIARGEIDETALNLLTDSEGNSLGIQLGEDFSSKSTDEMIEILGAMKRAGEAILSTEEEQLLELKSQKRIQDYINDSAKNNKANIDFYNASAEQKQTNIERSKALLAQAVQGNVINEGVMAIYDSILDKVEAGTATSAELATLEQIQTDMVEHLTILEANAQNLTEVTSLENKIAEALYNTTKKEIDELSNINDSINDANSKMISKLSEQINEARQQRDRDKDKNNISSLQSQLTYLMANSSGQVDSLALKEQISEEQQNYQDSLIDQKLQSLEDANAKAAEQRERQIAILESQLALNQENQVYQKQAEAIVASSLREIIAGTSPLDTRMGQIISTEEEWGKMTTLGQQQAQASFITSANQAANGLYSIENTIHKTGDENNDTQNKMREEIDGYSLNTSVKLIEKSLTAEYGKYVRKGEKYIDSNGNEVTAKEDQFVGGGDADKRTAAIRDAQQLVKNSKTGFSGIADTDAFKQAKARYVQANGKGDFEALVQGTDSDSASMEVTTGRLPGFKVSGYHSNHDGSFDEGLAYGGVTGLVAYSPWAACKYDEGAKGATTEAYTKQITEAIYSEGTSPSSGELVLYGGVPYVYRGEDGRWSEVLNPDKTSSAELAAQLKKELNTYKTGGLADFTGPAWLDGTKAHPELVLNARDTENFIQLKDILADILTGTGSLKDSQETQTNGVNSFDIDINVESISDDYDVEQLANKIRSMIYEDASYRNVNNINLIR